MAITLVASVTATPGSSGGTTAAINTTGATLLVLSTGGYTGAGATPVVTDSKGNTWTSPGMSVGGDLAVSLFRCLNPVVGPGHTFTVTAFLGPALFPPIIVYAFAHVASEQLDAIRGGLSTASPLVHSAVTPAAPGALIVTGLTTAADIAGGATVALSPPGFTVTTLHNPGVSMPAAAGFTVRSTTAPVSVTWSWTGGDTRNASQALVFLPDDDAGGVTRPMFTTGGTTGPLSWIELILKTDEE